MAAELGYILPETDAALELVMPGRLVARFLKSCLTLTPVLALVSINYKSSRPISLARL